jgi:hypothetical protein
MSAARPSTIGIQSRCLAPRTFSLSSDAFASSVSRAPGAPPANVARTAWASGEAIRVNVNPSSWKAIVPGPVAQVQLSHPS